MNGLINFNDPSVLETEIALCLSGRRRAELAKEIMKLRKDEKTGRTKLITREQVLKIIGPNVQLSSQAVFSISDELAI